jgi:hypothetical protein
MTKRTEDVNENAAPTTGKVFPRMLILEQVQEVLNVKSALVYSLVRSGELPAGQFGGPGVAGPRERPDGVHRGSVREDRRAHRGRSDQG